MKIKPSYIKCLIKREKIKTFILFYLLVIFTHSISVCENFSDDIIIEKYNGFLKKENKQGGFRIGEIKGNAMLTANGSIRIRSMEGNLFAVSTAGDIIIEEIQGNARVTCRAGNIDIKSFKHVIAQSELGEIIIRQAESVEIENLHGGDVKILNVSKWSRVKTRGSIWYSIPYIPAGSEICELYSREGDIGLTFSEELNADLKIHLPIKGPQSPELFLATQINIGFYKIQCLNNTLTISTRINQGGKKISLFLEKGGHIFLDNYDWPLPKNGGE